ncbi:MAG: terminase family protein [Bacteroidales bacterium]|nr:terminase family protein [Bacteroidales bacterium]
MSVDEKNKEFFDLVNELARRKKTNRIAQFYPDEGPLRRELYQPHLKFFKAGADVNIKAFMGGNRTGKTEGVGAYELTLHATGEYPSWWEGARFKYAPVIWISGKTTTKTRDTLQRKMLGELHSLGTGMLPGDKVDRKNMTMKSGTTGAVDTCYVEHVSGTKAVIKFKAYAEERQAFESDEVDIIWLDEEPTPGVFGECVTRTISTDRTRAAGHVLCTFTPLEGMSEVVLGFMPDGRMPGSDGMYFGNRFVIFATWDDVPHLTKEERDRLWNEIPVYQREARTKGVPQLGSGAIYPIDEEDVSVDDFEIPIWWPRAYGLDVGWNWTAAPWAAYDKESDVLYIYSTYKRGKAEPVVHAQSIKARGDWIPGTIDPNSAGSSQLDGKKVLDEYMNLLGEIYKADNAVEAGILKVWNMLSTGKLKVFKSCRPWFDEFRLYRRNERGQIVKNNDHLMDSTRYLCMMFHKIARTMPDEDDDFMPAMAVNSGRSAVTGY